MDTEIYSSSSEEETFNLGMRFADRLHAGDVVAFYGDLGTGKTEFIKGVCEELGVSEIVSSPTYTIVNQYPAETSYGEEVTIYHIDLYRIEDPAELVELGLQEILSDPLGIALIEWAHVAESMVPAVRWDVRLSALDDESRRRIEIGHLSVVPVTRATGTYGGR